MTIRQPDKTMYKKSTKSFDEIIFRENLPRQLKMNTCLKSLKRHVMNDYGKPICVTKLVS